MERDGSWLVDPAMAVAEVETKIRTRVPLPYTAKPKKHQRRG